MVARNPPSSSSSSPLLVVPSPRARAASAVVAPFCRFSASCYRSTSGSQRSVASGESIGSTETANSHGKSGAKGGKAFSYKRDVAAVQPRRRRVRFDYDENDAVRATVHVYPKASEEEKALCWNSKTDIQRMKKELHQETVQFVRCNPDYVGCLEKLFDSPLSRQQQFHTAAAKGNGNGNGAESFDRAAFVSAVMAQESAPRGLEYRMSFLIHRHKQWTTSTVLQRQAQLKREAALDRSSASASSASSSSYSAAHHRQWQVSEALARCCQHLSRCTRELAVQYARADALQAQKVYGDAFLSLCPM